MEKVEDGEPEACVRACAHWGCCVNAYVHVRTHAWMQKRLRACMCSDLHSKARVLAGICGLCPVGASARAHAHMVAVPRVCGARTRASIYCAYQGRCGVAKTHENRKQSSTDVPFL